LDNPMTTKTTGKTITARCSRRPHHCQLSIVRTSSAAAKAASTIVNCPFLQFLKPSLIKLLLPVVLLTSPLMGQGSWGTFGPPLKGESLISFRSYISRDSISLVVFDTSNESWRGTFEKLLADDSKLSELPLVIRREGMGAARELYERESWAPGPRWALIDWNSKVHSSGNSLPTAKELVDALDFSGIKTSIQRLREFVFSNPDNIDARNTLVQRLGEIASRRTAVALGIKNNKPLDMDATWLSMGDSTGMEFSNMPLEDEYTTPPEGTELNNQQDDAIWGEYVAELNKLFRNNNWALISMDSYYKSPSQIKLVPPFAKYSPLCRSAFTRNSPNVEGFLKSFPTHGSAWQVWIALTNASGRDLIKDSDKLLEELEPLPWDALDWPPPILQAALFKRAIDDENWDYIIKYGDSRWDMVLSMMLGDQKHIKAKPTRPMPLMTEHVWASLAAPLLEAHLAKGNLPQAEEIMDYWKLCDGWAGALTAAVKLAEKYKHDALAKSFAAKG
jgi:hypothetical protein